MDADPIAKRLAALSPAKRALFELRLKQRAAADSVDQTIPRRPPSASAPLSFAQQRLWFLNQLDPASPAYNEPRAIRLKGVLDINALQQALNQIVARHEVLRTTFVTVDGAPMQLIAEHRELDLSIVDLSASPGSTRESQIHDLLADEARRPFDLSRDLMLRALILRLEEREHIALLVTPHIASDGWSSGVLWREVSAIYGALVSGQPSALADLPIQYADYAIWQRHWLQGKVLDRQLTYWKKQLDGVSPVYLPADRARPALQTYRGEKQSLMLSEKLSDQLRALSRQHDVTLFMTVLGAFHVLLYRYSGQADIAVGTPFAGRTRAETESLIGFFVNTLVMRSNLSGNPSFREMLDRVREVTLGAHAHQDVPFEKLVQELNPERNLTTSPLFQVAFALQNVPKTVAELPGLDMSPVDVESGIAKFDLYVGITDQGHELTARAVYNTDLFNHLTIDRMLRHFQALLQSIVADPEQRILDLPMLTSAEKHRLLFDSNGAESDYPKNKCIHELFEAQVEKSPNAVAVASEDLQLTYRELNRRANQLAHFLRKLGIGPEILVGICLERSVEMIVGLLGILKSGAAYVPLDPDYPKERLEFMLGDAQAPVVLSEESLIESLPSQSARVVCLDKDWELIVQESPDNLTSETTADNLAYVIYTSGSTGRPKGVAVAHRAINRLVIHTDYVELTSADVMAQASNASFDAATFEIWGALLHGARLVIIPTEVMLSPRALASAIERYGITVLFLTTALFNQLIERIPSALAKLSHLLFGGEAADPLRVRELLRHGPPKRLLHVYGPTETTTFASSYLIENVRDGEVTVPIGRPIANTQIYVLDPRLSPAPIGIPGEIYIGGDGAARGYLNCPEVTAEKFIADPFSEKPGTRLYKTGDLARYLSDGNIEFLGRIDDQVKIRGYRIEPGEVESALIRHPAIHEAVVLAQEEGDSSASLKADRRLVAYAVVNQRPGPSTNELRSFLQLKLPEYMVPSAFVFLDSLPLTPNGKLDRTALNGFDSSPADTEMDYVAPSTETEKTLAGIWAELLSLERVGIHDNFFALGGHSLLGIKLCSRLSNAFQTDFPIRRLFESPTIAGLATSIDAGKTGPKDCDGAGKRSWSFLFELRAMTNGRPVFFFPGGTGGDDEFLVYAKLTHYVGKEFSFYGLRARSADGKTPAHSRVEEMVADYVEEIRACQPQGPYFLIGNCIGGIVAYEMAQQLLAGGEKIALLALMDTSCPMTRKHSKYRSEYTRERAKRFFQASVDHYFSQRFAFHCKQILQLGWRNKLPYLLAVAADVPRSTRVRRIQESYIKTLRGYRPKPYQGPMSLIVNEKAYRRDPTLGWSSVVSGKIDVYKARGDHDAYIREYVRAVAKQLSECLEKAATEI